MTEPTFPGHLRLDPDLDPDDLRTAARVRQGMAGVTMTAPVPTLGTRLARSAAPVTGRRRVFGLPPLGLAATAVVAVAGIAVTTVVTNVAAPTAAWSATPSTPSATDREQVVNACAEVPGDRRDPAGKPERGGGGKGAPDQGTPPSAKNPEPAPPATDTGTEPPKDGKPGEVVPGVKDTGAKPPVTEGKAAEPAPPTKDVPTKDVPTKADPTKADPTKADPTKDVPTKDVPTKDAPQDPPTKDAPQDAPTKAEPVPSDKPVEPAKPATSGGPAELAKPALPPLTVLDIRGDGAVALFADQQWTADCVLVRHKDRWERLSSQFSQNGATVPAGGMFVEGYGRAEQPDGTAVSYTAGNVGAGISAVRLMIPDREPIVASLAEGHFAVWWPTKLGVSGARLTGLDAAGKQLASVDVEALTKKPGAGSGPAKGSQPDPKKTK